MTVHSTITIMCLWDYLLVEVDESVYGTLPDLQRWEVWEEVIANEETHAVIIWLSGEVREEGGRKGCGKGRERGEGYVELSLCTHA